MLYYYQDEGQWWSQADNKNFFVSEYGKNNPKTELNRTLEELFDEDASTNIQCRFPGRTLWLQQTLKLSLPKVQCPELDKWLKQFSLDKLYIVFASANINSPPSMFGHTFLRVPHAQYSSELLSYSFNYGADVKDDVMGIPYMLKGLSGRYLSNIDTIPFYRRVKTYSDKEGRDIWEYQLDLTAAEVRKVILHIWEMKKHVFDYYFLDENCSYHILAIVNIARPELNLLDDFSLYTIPVDILRVLKSNKLIHEFVYRRSGTNKNQDKINQLSQDEQEAVLGIVSGSMRLDNDYFVNLSNAEKSRIFEVALDYVSLLITRDEIERTLGERLSQSLIAARLKLKHKKNTWKYSTKSKEPLEGHAVKRMTLSSGKSADTSYWQLGARMAYHDYFDPIVGYDKGSTVSMFEIDYRFFSGGSGELRRLQLINVESRPNNNDFFSSHTWEFSIARARKAIKKQEYLVNTVHYQRGQTFYWAGQQLSYLLGMDIDQGGLFDNRLGLEATARIEFGKQDVYWSYLVSFEQGRYIVRYTLKS